ncbi:MAG: sodium-dependent transporter, partial [Muribaculaceae bacterium]|nr:sodium-dependent transporter [Muribaculaceae bacterium]
LLNTYALILLNLGVLLFGVRKGIERLSNVLMPLLFVLLLVFCGVSMSLPGAADGLRFFFAPDFSKITPAVVISALGQAFFSLSLGMGILITYAAYYPKKTRLMRTAVTVSLLDMMAAILMGVVIFPAVTSFGLGDAELEGTALVFVTLPEVFARMPCTQLWSVLFFLLLLVAALTSTVSIAEVSVSFVQNRFRRSRRAACLIVLLPLFALSALSALSFGSLSGLKLCGLVFFDFLDTLATNIMLPVASILLCLFIGWRRPGVLRGELSNYAEADHRLQRPVAFVLRWIAPALILIVLVSGLL